MLLRDYKLYINTKYYYNMKIKFKSLLLSVLFLGVFVHSSLAFKGDLTQIVKRPGTNELFVCGEFNSIFVVDATSGETKRSIAVEKEGVTSLQFTPDGSILLAANYRTLYFINPSTGITTKTLSGSNFILSERSNFIVDLDRWGKKVSLLKSGDGSVINTITCEFEPIYASLSPGGKKLFILGSAQEIKNEKSLLTKEVLPVSGYNTYNKAFMEQQSDNKGASFLEVEVESFKARKVITLPYSPSMSTFGKLISSFNNEPYFMSFEMFFKLNQTGKVSPMETEHSNFAYAVEATTTGQYIINASGLKGFIYDCKNDKYTPFNFDAFMSSVYAKDISTSNDTIVLLGSDYTVLTLTTNGALIKKFRINKLSDGIKFGAFYTNGYTKKEQRDKEASIINGLTKEKNLPEIDLEKSFATDDKEPLIAEFDTYEQASDFVNELKNRKLNYVVKIYPVAKK